MHELYVFLWFESEAQVRWMQGMDLSKVYASRSESVFALSRHRPSLQGSRSGQCCQKCMRATKRLRRCQRCSLAICEHCSTFGYPECSNGCPASKALSSSTPRSRILHKCAPQYVNALKLGTVQRVADQKSAQARRHRSATQVERLLQLIKASPPHQV